MFRYYDGRASRLRYAPAYTWIGVGGAAVALSGVLAFLLGWILSHVPDNYFISPATLTGIICDLFAMGCGLVIISCLVFLTAGIVYKMTPDASRIHLILWRGLCCPAYGNPLGLLDGELLPKVVCAEVNKGVYDITIATLSKSQDTLLKIDSFLSAYLTGKYANLAIINHDPSPTGNYVTYRIDDVLVDKSITYHSVSEMRSASPYKLAIQQGTDIDLTTSGSMLIVGKTRGGKTTGVIALLMQILLQGRDEYGSEVVVVDPKQAELSRLPHTTTLDEDGEARAILAKLKQFVSTIRERQRVLNDLSEKAGDAVHWWVAGMHPSIIFIDEYVGCRSILPAKAAKGDDYCLDTFDKLVKVIVTTGASAGCYMVVSIAQASAGEGGLPTMIRSAMTTRVLFKPTLEEGGFIWDRNALETISRFPAGKQGDAWFSSTDGEHETVSRVHFPHMRFRVYQELGRLLREYYGD